MRNSSSRATIVVLLVTTALVAPLWAQSNEPVDLDAVARIKVEGLERSEVMDTLWYLTERYGARLTNSPNMHEAADWAADVTKNATVIPSFVYHTANRDDRLPREALPAPRRQ